MKPTQEQVMAWAREAGFARTKMHGALERFSTLAYEAGRKDENEACARLCDSSIHDTYIEGYTGAKHSGRRECATAIRARREQ